MSTSFFRLKNLYKILPKINLKLKMEVIKTIEGPVALTSVAISITTSIYFYRQIEELKKKIEEMSRVLSVTIEKLTEHNNQIDNIPIIVNNLRDINKDRMKTNKIIKKLNKEILFYRRMISEERMKINDLINKINQLTGEETEILPNISKKMTKKMMKYQHEESDSDEEPKKKSKKRNSKKKHVRFQKNENEDDSSEESSDEELSDEVDELCKEIDD